MLRIRRDQMHIFSEASQKSFEDRMVAHIKEFFPEHFAAIKEEGARELIRYGIQRSATYGITAERDVCKYVDVQIVAGPDYDKQPWANALLNPHYRALPADRINAVLDATPDHRAGTESRMERGI